MVPDHRECLLHVSKASRSTCFQFPTSVSFPTDSRGTPHISWVLQSDATAHFPSRHLEQADHDGSIDPTLFLLSTDIGAGPREDLDGGLPSARTHFLAFKVGTCSELEPVLDYRVRGQEKCWSPPQLHTICLTCNSKATSCKRQIISYIIFSCFQSRCFGCSFLCFQFSLS